METRDTSQRPPVASAGVAPFGPAANAGPPSSGGYRPGTVAGVVLAAVLVLAVGCGVGGGGGAPPEQAEDPVRERAPSTVPVPRLGNGAAGSEDDDFVASAQISGGEAGAADRIEGVRFQIFDDYERLLIDFGRDGGSAGIPRWSVESPAEGGYLRLRFPGVASTGITDRDFVGSVMDQLYLVRDRGGGLLADVFAMQEFHYRVTELPDSGQLAVDFRGAREELDLPPTTGDRVVVVQPREAEEVGSPLTVQGYTRLFEGQVTVSLLSREREVLSTKTVRASDWAAAWGLFETTLEFSNYAGSATLRVGSESPRDGSFVGTETEVFIDSGVQKG